MPSEKSLGFFFLPKGGMGFPRNSTLPKKSHKPSSAYAIDEPMSVGGAKV